MTFFEQFFSNTIFLTAAFGWLVAQILKTLIHLIVSKKFVAERLVGSGGMPSSHSATVCALVPAVCYEYGAGSFEFAISVILAIIVCNAVQDQAVFFFKCDRLGGHGYLSRS